MLVVNKPVDLVSAVFSPVKKTGFYALLFLPLFHADSR